mmetsp:Transcript_21022/g.31266  ORF Transcript_21022/g.31266 Transcript_21022/m.31266 type:complete len:195 (+) Transcript_21022:542-1126(+)
MLVIGHLGFLLNAYDIAINPIPLMIWVGIAYSLGAAGMWPILSYIVPTRVLSTAYGTMTSTQNLGLAVFPQIIGALQDAKGISGTKLQYTLPLMIFMGSALTSAGLCFLEIGLDKKYTQGRLNASGAERKKMDEEPEEMERPESDSDSDDMGGRYTTKDYEQPSIKPVDIRTQRRNYLGRLGIYQYAPSAAMDH